MFQRQLSEDSNGVIITGQPGMGPTTSVTRHRVLRAAAVALAAWSLAACSSLRMPVAGVAPMRYAALSGLGTAQSFNARVASNTLSESPLYAPNIAIGDSTLAATIVRMRAESPSFDSAMTALERSGIPTVIGTERQLRGQLPPGYGSVGGWQALTTFYPLTPNNAPGRRIEHVAVIVRLAGLQSALRAKGSTRADTAMFTRYLERVIGHEIYGHLMPQLQYGRTAPIVCDDPTSGADWYSACVMQRERTVVAQLNEARGTFAMVATH
jgi:hypothetical protein